VRAAKISARSAASVSCSASHWRLASSGRPISSQRRRKNFGSNAATVRWRPSADQVRAATGALALQQRREDFRDGPLRRAEVGDLHRRHHGSGVLEQAGPALVVEIVAGPLVPRAEAGERAVDDALGQLGRPDPEPLDDSWTEALQHDVRLGAQSTAPVGLGLEIDLDGLLAVVERLVPGRCELLHRVAPGRQEPYDSRAEPHQLAAGKRAREVASEVDDQQARERLH
jgi:hypothetical protein